MAPRRNTRACSAVITLALLAAPAYATAADTTLGFDDRPSGEELTTQYTSSSGVTFYRCAPAPFGDSTFTTPNQIAVDDTPRSPGQSVRVSQCQGEGRSAIAAEFSALQTHVTVWVRGGSASPAVTLTVYDTDNNVVGSSSTAAASSTWNAVSFAQPAGEAARIKSVALRRGSTETLRIDDFTFGIADAPPPGGGGGEPGGGAGGSAEPPPPPLARFESARGQTLRRSVWLSARPSQVAEGVRIVEHRWNLPGGKTLDDIRCGGDTPAISAVFRKTGTQRVGLTITDSLGRSATTVQEIQVSRSEVNRARGSGGTAFTCEDPGDNFQPDSTDCVKSFGFGIVDVNSQGDPDDCFKIEARTPRVRAGAGVSVLRRFSEQRRYYRAEIKDDIAFNGIPIPRGSNDTTVLDSGESSVIGGRIEVVMGPYEIAGQRVGPYRIPFDLGFKNIPSSLRPTGPKRTYSLGGFDIAGVARSLFGLEVGPRIALALTHRESEITFGAKLPNFFASHPTVAKPIQADAVFKANNREGIRFDGGRVASSIVFVGPLLVRNFFLDARLSDNTWNGGGELVLAPLPLPSLRAVPPPPDNGFGLRNGAFDHAGVTLDFPVPGTRPIIFPGVNLRSIGAAIGVNPTRFTGSASIAVGETLEVGGEVFAVFATTSAPYDFPSEGVGPDFAPLAGRVLDTTSFAVGGTSKLVVPGSGVEIPLVSGYALYMFPDYIALGGGYKYETRYFNVSGGVKGFLDVGRERFNLEGSIEACLRKPITICAPNVGVVVSSRGFGFCTVVPVPNPLPLGPPTVPIPAGAGFNWGETPDIKLFSCDIGPWREPDPRAARVAQGGQAFDLPSGLPSAMLRIRGESGAPSVTLNGPNGERIDTPDSGDGQLFETYGVIRDPEENTTLVALKAPAAGRWTVTAREGSTQITKFEVANGLPDPEVSGRLSGEGQRRVLRYTTDIGPGQSVTFEERGARTYRVLGRTSSRRGTLRFTPSDGAAGRREIVAVVEADGGPIMTIPVASYTARPKKPGRPRRIRVRRRGTTVAVNWRRVARTQRYSVTLDLGRGDREVKVTSRRRLKFTDVPVNLGGRIRIVAQARDGVVGSEGVGRLRAQRRR